MVSKHTNNRQRDLFRGDVTGKRIKEIKYDWRDKITFNSKNKIRTLFGYIRNIKRSKACELLEEKQNLENGGTEYWSTFRK